MSRNENDVVHRSNDLSVATEQEPLLAPPAEQHVSFPYKQLGVLAFCRLAEPIAFTSITAYSFVMVQEIKGEENASFYSGLLVSAFALAEALTAMFWGHLSDKYGRKPIIMVALGGTALSSLLFGFAKTYWLALLARVVGGLLNGNIAVMQTMVAEIVQRPEHEPKAYAMQPFMWGVGSIAGSALGGFTAKPAVYYPQWFSPDGIFGQFPYLLPNLVAVVVILVAMLQGAILLDETNMEVKSPSKVPRRQEREVMGETHARRTGSGGFQTSSESANHRSGSFVSAKMPIPMEPSFDLTRPSQASVITHKVQQRNESVIEDGDVVIMEEQDRDPQSQSVSIKAFTKSVIALMVQLILMSFHQMALAVLLPIYLQDKPRQSPQHLDLLGGLGITLPEVGTCLAINSIIGMFMQGFVFPTFVQKVGVWRSVMSLTIVSPVIYLTVPFVSLLANPLIGVYIAVIPMSFTTMVIYPCLLILLKDATPSTSVLGKVNGLAMSGCSGARTVAPPLLGIIYSSLGSAGAWWTCTIVALLAVVELCFISNPRRSESEIFRRASVSV